MRKKSEEAEKWSKTEEAKKWSKQKPTADSAVQFTIAYLDLRKSADDDREVPLDA
jgi:hypothetical protein